MFGREHLGLHTPWIEVKHVGDTVDTMRTRVYAMSYQGRVQHQAHAGFKLPRGQTLLTLHEHEDI
jgi:hypothetical protein